MIDFQKIRNKQKWLFGIIAIPVIIGFVILFTPDAEDRIFGRGPQSESGLYGQLDGEAVSRIQWIEARNIVIAQLGPQARGIPESFLNSRAVQVLGEKALMKRYGINPSEKDSDKWISQIVDSSLERSPADSRPTRLEGLSRLALNYGGYAQLEALARYQVGVNQLRSLAGLSGVLVSTKEAEIKFRELNEEYEAEAVFLNHTNYLSLVQSTDELLKKHYTNTLANHRIPERRQLSYVAFPASNYLAQAEKKFDALKAAGRAGFLTNYWPGIITINGYETNSIKALVKQIVLVRTNDYSGMKAEEAVAVIRKEILTTPQRGIDRNGSLVELKSGLAVIEAYKAGLDFQKSLEATYNAKPALDTLEKMALLQNLTAATTAPVSMEDNTVVGLARVTPSQAFGLSKTNAFIIGDPPFSFAGDFYIASLKRIIPSRNRSFVEAKATVTADFKKGESIKLMNEAGDKIQQAVAGGKSLEEVAKESNLTVAKLGPFDSAGGTIPGLANRANSEDFRTQALGLEVGETSELVTSSTDPSDTASEEAAFMVKLTAKVAVGRDKFDAEFSEYLESERGSSASRDYGSRLQDETRELYRYSLKTYPEGGGTISVESDDGASGFYKQGTRVKLVATPNAGFTFKEWSGAVTINTGSATNEVTVSRNSSVTASFVERGAE
ncbi:uncharacterized protein METZ01_LOCUS131856 [marine metagenome]|uniref:Bacterial repeat domain-containing protein n=1 Tax=marine metagenome TaxID=408172 RepID=A0A381YQT9_9ZZZZ|tara:strand:- start:2126 stop:4132 length:2007 start_codon:yes stop_codon:yes gene_type:complete